MRRPDLLIHVSPNQCALTLSAPKPGNNGTARERDSSSACLAYSSKNRALKLNFVDNNKTALKRQGSQSNCFGAASALLLLCCSNSNNESLLSLLTATCATRILRYITLHPCVTRIDELIRALESLGWIDDSQLLLVPVDRSYSIMFRIGS